MKGFEQPKDSEPREGAGFIMKEGISPTTPQSDISVEFRPGESSESVMAEKMAEKNKRHEKEKERTKYFTTEADWTEDLLKSMLLSTPTPILRLSKLNLMGLLTYLRRIDGIPVFLKLDDFTPAGLYQNLSRN